MRRTVNYLLVLLLLSASTAALAAQNIWQNVAQPQSQTLLQARAKSVAIAAGYFNADDVALRNLLRQAPLASTADLSHQLELPMPDGSLANFQIVEAPIMQDGLAQKYPGIKTYKVFGIDDPYASGRVDITSRGFSGMLYTSQGRVFIDPDYVSNQPDLYLSRYRSSAGSSQGFSCGVDEFDQGQRNASPLIQAKTASRMSGSLLEYRLAVSATEEYVTAVFNAMNTDTAVDQAQAAIATAINRVNVIYERDLGITLMLVAGNDQLIEDGGNVSFSNNDANAMFTENQAWIDTQITSANYEIGHIFATGSGGLAFLASVCDDQIKAKGVTGHFNPLGDLFYIDFVAHEIGHQFNADHSFNGTSVSCQTGRNSATAFEPGSGSTIMAYAGICGVEDIQNSSDATFHAGSIAQIDNFTAGAGGCFAAAAIMPANNEPVIAAIGNKFIPANTAFVLDASATDADMDALLYQWDQMDAGCATDAVSFGTDNGSNSLFRSYQPQGGSARDFPALGTQVRGLYDDAEVMPCNNRDLDFRLTVHDGKSGQGFENVRVSVNNTAGPFVITNLSTPGTILNTTVAVRVNWIVANTNRAPINCANVDIDLLTFDDVGPVTHETYSVHPLGTTPNTGTHLVNIVPVTNSHPRARIRVKCSDNIFYDISDVDLDIRGTDPTPINFSDADFTTFFNNNGTTGIAAPACGAVVNCTPPPPITDSGAFSYLWLLLLTGLVAGVKLRRRQEG